ncbi:Phthiocerol/phenolphthiocerol synthesis polyketide synthase type I PpsB [Streptomyces sp. YIM 130001]|uniref:type I polyketide synthase n=1 Tax=Streptomyces sp. YIM 130001 TaxID=2259644 RepID=UPI000E653DCF|nr:type I polyketide synthase [Streptomyces sp. YIM 130001]RII14709.1 Phthiocerol/phenolphthiocerol synthesis polyketide synthase type I PpsB [Streptomyces sp. YIM 130001]
MRAHTPHVSPKLRTDLVVAVNPLHRPSPRLTAAVCRAGALGVLELPDGRPRRAAEALERTAEWCADRPFGVRVRPGCPVPAAQLPDSATTVLLADPRRSPAEFPGRRVLVEVTSAAEAAAAQAGGADGLLLRGSECGGRAGELSTFVLLQRVLADPAVTVPVWVWGGIGPRTAAAATAGGAEGVVLDVQLALLDEAVPTAAIGAELGALDGSETALVDGVRYLRRRGPGAPPAPVDGDAVQRAFASDDPGQRLLPVGQDGYLATSFASGARTVAEAVRRVRDAVTRAAADPSAPAGALAEGSPGAQALGTRLPIVQGPMTRVSDEPAFAAAVAAEGGLPFLALALADAGRTRTMLERTRELVGPDTAWGVGILGFADEQVKEAQLAVVRELKPSHAIIAGGRPAQAAALEAEGISAFLHVPSPGLLRQFLAAGARKFIFEGAECGGHIGPRNSFPLWEAQTEVLRAFVAENGERAAAELTVLFAGGIHDDRSAAMAATVAAPLVEKGAAFGVLMGTAYLFTDEAVGAGAIKPLFQRRVRSAERTQLLETAPGHATRCAASHITHDFAALRSELAANGVPDREAWEQLERFNVGRLRLASKGVERVGDVLHDVDEERQDAEGMFMAGEVCVLRTGTTTLAALHENVTRGAADLLHQRADRPHPEAPETETAPPPLRVAVVGMSAMFPGAPDLAEFWSNVVSGKDSVTEVPTHRWDPAQYYDPEGDGEQTPSRWGGFLPEIPFDPLRYGIPPAALPSIEPVQLLALEAARRALADAGYEGSEADHRRTSVIFGAEAGSDLSNATTLRTVLPAYTGTLPPGLDAQLPRLTEDSFPGMLANVIAGRIANRLDLGGANYTVDAACASSLTAVDTACKELTAGTSDLVLCGGADLHNGINDYLLFSSVHALSPTGRSATFDARADGIALGEGVACVALKRLADAERDGDRIYAVIDGVGSASDGRALGLTAPRPEGQRSALTRAYRNARVAPSEVGLVEAHGTGTVVGDRTELGTLTEVFTESGARPGSCAIGSVKSQIGHTKCAAGLAGLIKTTLALHHGVKPPTLHLSEPNPAWDRDSSPFAFHTTAAPWATEAGKRIAGVSAFGFGGTNFHVVLRAHEQAPEAHALHAWPAELFTFRGRDEEAAREAARALGDRVAEGGPWRLRDHARNASWLSDQAALRGEPVRIAVVARDIARLPELLRRAADGEHAPGDGLHAAHAVSQEVRDGRLAFLYPGQGSQRPGMFADLFVAFPELHRYLRLGSRWAGTVFPPAALDKAAERQARARITDTDVAQPALGLTALAATDLLGTLGVRPDMAGGHSYGELAALAAADVLNPAELLDASAARAAAILGRLPDDDPGTMAAVGASAARVEEVLQLAGLADDVVAANHNSPEQTVISGPTRSVTAAVTHLGDAGLTARTLKVACAFHSPLLAGAGDDFGTHLAQLPLESGVFPVWSNRTAAPYPSDPEGIRAELAQQIGSPVRFAEQIESMYEAGARVFVEAGPGSVLSRLVSNVLGDRPHRTVPLEQGPDAAGLPGLLTALAHLAVSGVDVRTRRLFTGRDTRDPATAEAVRPPAFTVDGQLLRRADGSSPPHALQPARPVTEFTVPDQHQVHPAPAGPEELITDFLRSSRDLVAAQRDVLLSYLGAPELPGEQTRFTSQVPESPAARPTMERVVEPQATSEPQPTSGAAVLDTVLAVVAERTGYPVDMIEPGLDLEADLSIDSIKRVEIAGELAVRLGLPVEGGAQLDELSAARTVEGIAGLLTERIGGVSLAHDAPNSPAALPAPVGPAAVLDTVLAVVAERTGYPVDMIEPGLDLEADLSVDSIKRTEIAGELGARLGLDAETADLERLSTARTAAALAELIGEALGGPSPSGEAPAASTPTQEASSADDDRSTAVQVVAPERLTFTERDLEPVTASPARGSRVQLIGGGDTARELAALLHEDGVHTELLPTGQHPATRADAVIHLGALDSGDPLLPDAFPLYQRILADPPQRLLTVDRRGSGAPSGLRGFHRSVAREYPQVCTTLVEVPGTATPSETARALRAELAVADADAEPVVLAREGRRHALHLAPAPLGAVAATGAGPAGDGAAEADAAGLDRASVVLLVGGARGITARFARTLAAATRCRLVLAGRTPEPTGPEDPLTAAAGDRAGLRAALLASGATRTPADTERRVGALLAEREVRATLAALRDLGSEAQYHRVDVTDAEAVGALVKDVHAQYGRLDGLVHAAGVIEDRLIADKSPDSFARVFATKADGARTVLDAVDTLAEGPRFAVLFGSIAAALGNRGQSDYAGANDVLEELGRRWSTPERRGLTVHWGPWAASDTGGGMVTPELMRSYAARGIKLIDLDEGPLSLLRELAYGAPDEHAVVYTASGW